MKHDSISVKESKLQALLAWRQRTAEANGVKPHALVPTKALDSFAEYIYPTEFDLLDSGIKPSLAARWGDQIISIANQAG